MTDIRKNNVSFFMIFEGFAFFLHIYEQKRGERYVL